MFRKTKTNAEVYLFQIFIPFKKAININIESNLYLKDHLST